ncbi:ROK family protein [Bacillus sp. AK128]
MTWNQQVVKANNKQTILQMIKEQAPISRATLAQQLGLTKGTVSSLVSELLDANLCYESGPGESSGGRRPVMLLFNGDAGFSIGIDIGVNYILGILTDLEGNIISELKQTIKKESYEEGMMIVKQIIHSLIKGKPASHYGVIGIGVGVPGIVNKEGEVLLAPNLGWKNSNLKRELEEEFNLPVLIENEANAGAYGEKVFGSGKEKENLIYVSAGIGIGVGFILNNQLYRGAEGFSGEMGHMIIHVNGRECTCGSQGCWEQYASEQSLLNSASSLIQTNNDITLEYLIEEANKSTEIQALFTEIGHYLGIGINNISNTFNPEQIIIGNRLAMAKEWLMEPMVDFVKATTLKHSNSHLDIRFSDLSIYSSALGVSAQTIETFLANNLFEQVN